MIALGMWKFQTILGWRLRLATVCSDTRSVVSPVPDSV